MMKQLDFISGVFWLLIGLGLTIWTLAAYEIGSLTHPGPGFVPLTLGCLLLLFSLILLVGQMKNKTPGAKPAGSRPGRSKGWRRVVYSVLIVMAAAFFFERVGYLLTFFLLIALLMWAVTRMSWKGIFFTAILATVGVHLVFIMLLGLQLPRGFLGG